MSNLAKFVTSFAENDIEETNETKRQKTDDDNNGLNEYTDACRSLGIVPIRKVSEQLKEGEMTLQHVGMNSTDCKALACALWVKRFYNYIYG